MNDYCINLINEINVEDGTMVILYVPSDDPHWECVYDFMFQLRHLHDMFVDFRTKDLYYVIQGHLQEGPSNRCRDVIQSHVDGNHNDYNSIRFLTLTIPK